MSNQPYFTLQMVKLPDNFAQRVMQLQMQLQFQQSSTLQVVQQLNDLYRTAIQYFMNVDVRKMQHFQRKLTSLLTHPNTLQVIENRNSTPSAPTMRNSNIGAYSKTLKHEMNKFNCQSNVLVKSMLQGSEIKAIKSNRMINQNIENQQEALRRRLESRSKSRSFKVGMR